MRLPTPSRRRSDSPSTKVCLKTSQLLFASPQLLEFARSWLQCVRSVLSAVVIRGFLGYLLSGVPNLKVGVQDPAGGSTVSCEVLYEPAQERQADIIFVHGLHGSLVNTWRQGSWRSKHLSGISRIILRPEVAADHEQARVPTHDPTQSPADERCAAGCACRSCYSPCWPKDWLPLDCPNARVIALNYTTDPYLWRPIWVRKSHRTTLQRRADEMAAKLVEAGVGDRPIVWVGHSKGGLFIKQMYAEAYEQMVLERARPQGRGTSPGQGPVRSVSLWLSTRAFLFYSVPHRGSLLATIRSPLTARSVEVLEIAKDGCEVLALQTRWLSAVESAQNACHLSSVSESRLVFGDLPADRRRPRVVSFVETVRTLMAVMWLTIVSVESADAGVGVLCGVPLDHREICKPSGRQCFLYRELVQMVRDSTGDASHAGALT